MDEAVALMSYRERGVYLHLLCHNWLEDSLPNDSILLAKICALPPSHFQRVWNKICHCFQADADGRLRNPRLSRERDKQDFFRKLRSEAGRHGGRPKANGKQTPSTEKANAKQPGESKPEAKKSSSFSCLLSPLSEKKKNGSAPPLVTSRSHHPVFRGQRFTVFDWMLDDLLKLLGPYAESFDLHQWFFDLDERTRREDVVIPQRDHGAWLQAETLHEAQRRGLAIAVATGPSATGKLTQRMAALVAESRGKGS